MPSPAGPPTRSASSAPEELPEAEVHPTFEEEKEELAEARLPAKPRRGLMDVTPLARHRGLLPPTAITLRLWADIEAIPPDFDTETVHGRLTRVLQNAFLAVMEPRALERTDAITQESLLFCVSLPTIAQESSDYPVVLHFRPGASPSPVFVLMAPEEVASLAAHASVYAL